MHVVPNGQQKQASEHPQVPLWQLPPHDEFPQSEPLVQPHMPAVHVAPSGAPEQSATHVPLEQQPPLHVADALHELEQVPPLHAWPGGQSVALWQGPPPSGLLPPVSGGASSTTTSGSASTWPLASPDTSAPASYGTPPELPPDPLPDPPPDEEDEEEEDESPDAGPSTAAVASPPPPASERGPAPSPCTPRPQLAASRRAPVSGNVAGMKRIASSTIPEPATLSTRWRVGWTR
jgi:hypothetical protein